MRKLVLLTTIVVLGLVAGCTTATPSPTATPVPTEPPTAVPATGTPRTAECRARPFGKVEGLPPVSDRDWVRGPATASITLIEYSDFQCPGCAGVDPLITLLEEAYGNNLRVVYRHFPLTSIHDKAFAASEATEAAGAQGKFWEMHDLLFQRQAEWSGLTPAQFLEALAGYAEELGLDMSRFREEMEGHVYTEKVQESYDEAVSIGLPGTPTMFINGRYYPWNLSQEAVDAFLALISHEYDNPPPQVIDPTKKYIATLRTTRGDIVIDLFADHVPVTVNSFVFLAREGWYDGMTFFRVLPDFIAQTGDPTDSGYGSPGYMCDDEIVPTLNYDTAGMVGMASQGPGTSTVGSQFFITYAPLPTLNGQYPIIGRVIEGMDVLQNLTPRDPQQGGALPPGDVIETIVIEER